MFKISKIFTLVFLTIVFVIPSCSLYHLQTPETLPQGKVSGGIGITGVVIDGENDGDNFIGLPGLWVRAGVAPNTDVGVHTWLLGMKMDVKHGFNEYIALGGGGAVAFLGGIAYNLEGSLYLGIPIGSIYPYGVVRYNLFGFSAEAEEEDVDITEIGTGLSTVGGLQIKLGSMLSTYIEGGVMIPLGEEEGDAQPMFGLGISIGH
jgi:hypothetical protein